MKIELLMAEDSEPCERAMALWRSVCSSRGLELTVLLAESAEGSRIIGRLGLRALPVLLIDGKPAAVGLPTREQALVLISCNAAKLQ